MHAGISLNWSTMMNRRLNCNFGKVVIAALGSCLTLTGCYVVPVTADGRPYGQAVGVAPAVAVAPLSQTANVRLYPTNQLAAPLGVINAQVTNFLDGRGQFTANIAGENFVGEATRAAAGRAGLASGAGSRGNSLQCNYTMTHATQGSGRCSLSSGAQFNMHIGG
jgi:hypothetical protein